VLKRNTGVPGVKEIRAAGMAHCCYKVQILKYNLTQEVLGLHRFTYDISSKSSLNGVDTDILLRVATNL
jgi:hypothetical protein